MSENQTEIQDSILKKVKKLYRCSDCTNSVILTIVADVVCTRCSVPMRLFEAEQAGLFKVDKNNEIANKSSNKKKVTTQ